LFHPHGGGAELATFLYANLLSEEDFSVAVVTNRFVGEPEVSKDGNLTIYRLPLFKNESMKYSMLERFDVLFSSFMRKLMRWADVIYIPRFWYAAILLAKVYGKPVVTHLHDYIPMCPLATLYNASKYTVCNSNSLLCSPRCIYVFERTQHRDFTETLTSIVLNSTLGRYFGKSVKFSDAIICVSKVQRDMIIEGEPSLRDKTYVIYNPLPEISCKETEGDDFGYYGGPNYLKGFHILYQAVMHISHTSRGAIKIHATKFASSSRQFAKSLSELGILLYGKLSNEEYDKLYRQIRAAIVPSIWCEPWPYVVVEAIIRGRFLIASSIGGIPEQVEGCKGTLLFEAGNYEKLAEAIESVRSLKRETIIDLGSQNKETFLRRFDNKTTIRRFINVCEDLT
jgi:glycosyltransferase involved in cell wall biosynthesis